MIILQTRFPEPMDMMSFRRRRPYSTTTTAQAAGATDPACAVCVRGWDIAGVRWCGGGRDVIFFVVFAIQDDGPTGREGGVVDVEVVGLEEETSENGLDGESLAIGEVDYRLWHFDCVALVRRCMLCSFLYKVGVVCRRLPVGLQANFEDAVENELAMLQISRRMFQNRNVFRRMLSHV